MFLKHPIDIQYRHKDTHTHIYIYMYIYVCIFKLWGLYDFDEQDYFQNCVTIIRYKLIFPLNISFHLQLAQF